MKQVLVVGLTNSSYLTPLNEKVDGVLRFLLKQLCLPEYMYIDLTNDACILLIFKTGLLWECTY